MSPGSPTVRFVAVVLWMGSVRAAAPEVLIPASAAAAVSPDAAVDAWLACRKLQPLAKDCGARRSAAVEILVHDFHALGARRNFAPLPTLLKALRGAEPELRAAAADGIGMIGPRATETALLAAAFNDPVPAVRQSARVALEASGDERAKQLAGRARNYQAWKSFEPERAPDLAKLGVAPYAGAQPLRFAVSLQEGKALLATTDPPEKVVAFYAAKAKRTALSLAEFEAAYSNEKKEPEPAADGMPSADQMAQAMQMMQKMNESMNSGKSAQEAATEMGGAAEGAGAAANTYDDAEIYASPKVVVLEETEWMGAKRPLRYVVVFGDLTLGKTGIALHGPPVLP